MTFGCWPPPLPETLNRLVCWEIELVCLSCCCNNRLQRQLGAWLSTLAFAPLPRQPFSILPCVVCPRVGIQTPHFPDRLVALVPMLPRVCVVLAIVYLLGFKCGCLLVPLQVAVASQPSMMMASSAIINAHSMFVLPFAVVYIVPDTLLVVKCNNAFCLVTNLSVGPTGSVSS